MTDRRSGEKSLCELKYSLYLTLNYGTASEHLDFMVLLNVFVAFVGLNNNTIVCTKYQICISLVSPMPDPQKMTASEPIPSIGSMHLPIYYASLLKGLIYSQTIKECSLPGIPAWMEKDLPNWMGDIILMVSLARYIASYSLMKTERASIYYVYMYIKQLWHLMLN